MSKYDGVIAEIQAEDDKLRARAAGVSAPQVDPDAMGRAMRLADQRGLAPGVVADNLPEYDQQQQLAALDDAASSSPVLARWLGDPNHTALAKDDTSVLGAIGLRMAGGMMRDLPVLPGMALPAQVIGQFLPEPEKKEATPEFRAPDQPSWFSELVGTYSAGWQQGKQANIITVDSLPGGPKRVDPATGRLMDGDTAALAASVADFGRRSQAAEVMSDQTRAQFERIAKADETGQWLPVAGAWVTSPRAVMSVVAQSFGSQTPQLALSFAMPASAVLRGIVGGVGSFTAEQGMTVLDSMQDVGVDTSDAAQVSAFMRDPKKMAAARERALKRGVAVGLFDGLSAGFAGRLLSNARRSTVSIGSRVLGEGAVQMGFGMAGETAGQLAGDGKITSRSDIIAEGIAEFPTFILEGRGQIAQARRNAIANADRFDASQEQRSIGDLVQLASQSKTRERSASRFESLISEMTAEGSDTVYLSADGAQRLFQSGNTDGGPDLSGLVDADALREAIASGGEVAIPLAKYATLVTPELHAAVADQVRLQPGGRHDLPAVSPEEIQQAIDDGLAEAQQQDARENGPAGQVYDDVVGQLLSRQDEKLARQNASVVQSVYRNLAERVGTDAWSLYQQFKINIPGAATDTRARPRGVDIDVDPFLDALRTGKLPTDREVYGDSLASALHAAGGLRDSGGELSNMDAAKQRPGLVNNLAGMTLDDALVWAYQEGFITQAPTNQQEGAFDADAPDINTLLDMLAQDLGGNPVYRPAAMNAERAAFRDNAMGLQEELDQRGIDLQQADNATARQALGYANRTLEQSAIDQTQTPEFQAWFGDSKVVDAEGRPLVVYHGTASSFDTFVSGAESRIRESELSGDNDAGFYFTSDPVAASTFAEWQAVDGVTGAAVVPAYLAINNPLVVDGEGRIKSADRFNLWARNARDGGHDGLVINNIRDGNNAEAGNVYVAFRPEQIKSATGNRGTFDPADPRIDYAVRDLVAGPSGRPESAATRALVDQAVADGDLAKMLQGIAAQEGIDADQSALALRLAEITPDLNVTMVPAPANANAAGIYNNTTNEIWINQAVPSVVLHEVLHGVTSAMMTSPTLRRANPTVARAVAEFNDLLGTAQAHFAGMEMEGADVAPALRATLEDPRGPLSNIKELLTYGMTDKPFQQWLATVPAPIGREQARTAWQWFKDAIASMLGVNGKERSALDALIESAGDLVDFAQANPRAVNFAQMSEASRLGAVLDPARAYHGTPHAVDRFSLQKIGTGEGAQAFGWGLYFAGKREVAEHYRERLSDASAAPSSMTIAGEPVDIDSPEGHGARLVFHNGKPEMKRLAKQMLADAKAGDPYTVETAGRQGMEAVEYYQRVADTVNRVNRRDVKITRGNLYEVEIPEDGDLLDNEGKIARQNDKVQAVARRFLVEEGYLREGENGPRQLASSFRAAASEIGGMARGGDGQTLYEMLAKKLGSEQAASQYLNEHGIPGIRYKAGQIAAVSNAGVNYVIWDEDAISPPTRLLQGGANPRGAVTFEGVPGARVFNIELLKGMDASTFMHEMGHVYLEVLNDLAAREDAPAQITNDMATLNAWLGREAGTAFTVDQHEQFARGWEAYLREGKAPSSALRRTFAAFKVWLTALYRSVRSLNVELTDDVRNVMDRIVASDAEIEDARAGQYQGALIADGMAVGMTFEQLQAYNEAVSAARADAEATVAAEVLLAERREQQAWYNREKREVRAQVLEEVRNQPVYRAQRLLRNGKLPNGDLAPDELRVKLSKDELLDKFGQSFLRNLTGMYSVEGGVRSDEVAAIYGFGSGREMIDALVNAPKLADAVASETESRMKDRHPDPMTDGTLPDRAMIAAHRDRQADVMVREIRALEQHVNGRQVSQAAVIKGVARQIIQDKKLRHLQPATFRSAEAKAGREAFEAAAEQEWGEALAARRRQLLNFELFREAVRARDEAARTAKYLAKFGETKTRARLGKAGADYLDQVDGLLDRFDFRKISDKAADRRSSLATWIEVQAQKGIDVNLPAKIMDEAFAIPYREMTVADLATLRDAIRSIDHLARLKGKLLLAGEVRDAEEIDAAMAASLSAAHASRPVTTGDRTNGDKIRQAFMQGRVLQGTATDIARELDGFVDQGAVWMNTVGVMREAVNNRLNPALDQAQKDLADVYLRHYSKEEIRTFSDRVPMREVNGDLWSKSRLLGLALNWGNAGNREAILTQAKARMTPEQVGALLGKLDARDWAFVEGVWKLIDAQWPAIAEAQKRRTGLVPERVQASPFTVQTSDGKTLQIPGGYYPLKYESDSVKTMKDEADDFYNSIRTGRTAKAVTRNGHTIERVGSGGRTVRLDTGVVQQHLRDVLRDVHLGDAVNYVHNVLNGQEFKEAIDATGLQEYRASLEVWLKDAAAGEIGPRVWHEMAMRAVRQNFTASVLTFKVTSALLQLSGVVPTAVALGTSNTVAGVSQFLGKPVAMTRYVRSASPYMDSRLRTHIEAVQAVMDAEAGRFAAGKAAMIRFGYWMIGRVQGLVDTVTWLAAEQAGMAKFGNDVARARAYADDVVTRAQGSGEFIDKSPLQRGTLGDNVRQTEWIKATTMLQGYMIAKGNLAYEQTRKTNFRDARQAMKWAADMVMLFSVEGLLTAALTAKLPKDDEDDGLWDDLGEWAIKDTLSTFFGVIPGGGVLVDQFRGYDSSGVVAGAWKAYAELLEQLTPGEDGQVDLDKGVVKAAVSVAGVTLGLPSLQINKTIDAIEARADGRDVSPYEYLTGPKKEPK